MVTTPYGYRIVHGEAVIDTEEALNLRTFFRLYLQGFPIENAGKDAGIKMSLTATGMMLSNRTYLGDGFFPLIIDEETFEAAQVEREKRNRRPTDLNSCIFFPVPKASRFRLPITVSLAPERNAASLFSAVYDSIESQNPNYNPDCFGTTMTASAPSRRRLSAPPCVGAKNSVARRSVSTRFASSGKGRLMSWLLSPASTCPTGICR